jgi:hypothetical protein
LNAKPQTNNAISGIAMVNTMGINSVTESFIAEKGKILNKLTFR